MAQPCSLWLSSISVAPSLVHYLLEWVENFNSIKIEVFSALRLRRVEVKLQLAT